MKKENNGSRPLREELNSSAVSEQNAAASSELANQAQILKGTDGTFSGTQRYLLILHRF